MVVITHQSLTLNKLSKGWWLLALLFFFFSHCCSPTLAASNTPQSYQEGAEYSLSELTVLLPYTSSRARVKYLLHARAAGPEQGCFRFRSMNPDIILTELVYEEGSKDKSCTSTVSLSVAPNLHGSNRVSTFVVAEDVASGRVMRCEVFVAVVAGLAVHTTTKSVYRDEFERLTILATDKEGNTFSSLRGVEFAWSVSNEESSSSSLSSSGKSLDRSVLKIVPFKGSQQEVDPLITQMEYQGLQTDVILVQGISIGRSLVSVQLMDSLYSSEALKASVSLLVFESFMITPAHTLYITVGTQVFYHLWNIHQQHMSRVWMPNPLFTWSTSNETVASVDNKGDALALHRGYTAVIVCAGNLRENEARGAVQVVDPARMTVSIEQKGHPSQFSDEHFLVVGREYIMKVFLYDRLDHSIFYNGTVVFDLSIPSQEHYITIQAQSQSRNISNFTTKSTGHTQFTISLNHLKNAVTGERIPIVPPLSTTLSVFITDPISLGCSKVFLPWADSANVPHYQLKALGGSNQTTWYSTEKDITGVDSRGYLTGVGLGTATVIVEDRNNALNREKITVVVGSVPPISLKASSYEVLIGKTVTIHAGMWDWAGHTTDGGQYDCFSCDTSSLEWTTRGDAFVVDHSDPASVDVDTRRGQCATGHFMAAHPGSSVVHVNYGDSHAEITIFAYEPLRVVDPLFSLVTLASSTEFQFEGGPAPWYQDTSLHYLSTSNEEVQAIQTSRNTVRIACRSHGDYNVTVTAGNRATDSNSHPATSSVVVPFRCHPVASIRLVPPSDISKLDSRCVVKDESGVGLEQYRFPNYYSIPFGYELRDKDGKPFTNSTSILLDWVADNKTVASFVRPLGAKASTKMTLNTEKVNGTTVVRVSVTGYKSEHLREAHVLHNNVPTINPGQVEHKLRLVLFDKLALSSYPSSPLFVDSRVFVDVLVHGGSGVFSYQIQNTSVARIASGHEGKDATTIKVYPVAQGNAEVVVGDLCTPEYDKATEVLYFSGTHNLLVTGADKVAVNSTVKFTVQPTDLYGTPFHTSQYIYMDFAARTDDPGAYIEKTSTIGDFIFRSEHSGLVDVVFSVTTTQASPPIKASKIRQVIVFPPFRVNPSAVTLLVGETLDVSWKGGPYDENVYRDKLKMVFDSANPAIAIMEPERTVRGKSLGTTTIRISPTLRDKDPEFNVYDELHVTVRQMNGVHVRSGSTTLLESNTMKLHVEGHDSESPLGFGLRNVFFTWESDNTRVLAVEQLATTKTLNTIRMGVSVRVVARAPGRATITALAMPLGGPDSHAGQKDILGYPVLKDTITIEVSPKIGSDCDRPILLPPHGQAQLDVDSRFPHQDIKYSLMHPSQGTSCGDIVRSVTKEGYVKVGASNGHCHVHVTSAHTNQALSRHIVVEKVALLVTGPHREGDTVLDVRQRMEYQITPKDALGNEFSDTSRIRVDFEVAPAGIVHLKLDNLTLSVTAERPGKAVVRIFLDEDHKVQEFFEVHVRDTAPSSSFTKGAGPASSAHNVKVYADKPVSHHIPLEPTWYRVEFLKPTGTTEVKPSRFQCSILEAQWARAQSHSTSTANYCIVNPIVPAIPTDVVPNLTLVIDSNELQVHHQQTIPLAPIFTVLGAQPDKKLPISQTPQTVTLVSPTPHIKVDSNSALRVRPASSQRPVGSGYVTEYTVELIGNPQAIAEEDLYVRFTEEGKGAEKQELRVNFAVEESGNYLLLLLCTLLVIVLTFILGGIPCRTFPRAIAKKTLPTTPGPTRSPSAATSTPISPQTAAPLDLPPFIPSIHPVTPIPPYPTSSPYGATPSTTYSPRSSASPQTPSSGTPSRFLINTNQNFYDSQRLRGPKF